ncbi:MAG: sigma-70 family RNA polymerase sigma factor [Kofleriaceae bacterium]|nr:sigma-70 family RNA polymerase sigma factor [Kofleriaceae bacterium]MBP6839441.1 sigma-70 family RNA polymerase sigma factor [Kofleriaceae bacterium]MBP9206898.1 sigma-70 family RNA polymerase sigma factor [Kofleriaceae bacterium]
MADDLAADVVAARAGDRAAFARLYQRFARAVHGVVLARLRPELVADVVQEVFVVALERLGQLSEPAAFPGWLMAIARNRATDAGRRRVHAELVSEPAAAPTGGPGQRLDATRVLTALQALPEAYREPLVLRLVEGLTGPEIAEQTGLTPGSVRVNLHRGMKLLRAALGLATLEGSDD